MVYIVHWFLWNFNDFIFEFNQLSRGIESNRQRKIDKSQICIESGLNETFRRFTLLHRLHLLFHYISFYFGWKCLVRWGGRGDICLFFFNFIFCDLNCNSISSKSAKLIEMSLFSIGYTQFSFGPVCQNICADFRMIIVLKSKLVCEFVNIRCIC